MAKLHSSPYILNSFLNQFPELVVSRGGHFTELCERVGLPVEMATGRYQLIPFDKFIALLEAAESVLNYPDIAFDLASQQNIDSIGPLSRMVNQSDTFSEALNNILQYLEVLTSGFKIRANHSKHLLELNFEIYVPQLRARRQFQNYLLASTVSTIRRVIDKKYPLRECYFSQIENNTQLKAIHKRFFGCSVSFGAPEIKLTVDSAILKEPVQVQSALVNFDFLNLDLDSSQLKTELEDLISLNLAGGEVSLPSIAKSIGYSERTFRRRLTNAGLSFNTILASVRLTQANRYLQSTHYRMSDIAALLGYANQSAFTRSYIRWCGMSPKVYREALKDN